MNAHQSPGTDDPVEAAAILAELEDKKRAEKFCHYPGCPNEREPLTGKIGRRKAYCSLKEHNAGTAFDERARLKALVAEAARESSPPADKRSPATLFEAIMSLIFHLEKTPGLLAELRAIGNPDLVLSQIQAAEDQASIRVATAEGLASDERSRRLAAEKAQEEAEGEAREARETTEAVIQDMREMEEKTQLQLEEAELRVVEALAEKEQAIAQAQSDAQSQIAEIQKQADEAIAQAQTKTDEALDQAKEADIRANTVETEARERIAAAAQLVREANANLERERAERARETGLLREELIEARKQTEQERAERVRETGLLREELTGVRTRAETERTEASALLGRERTAHARETDLLREELTQERKRTEQATRRADKLAELADGLRAQLANLQTAQIKEQEKPNQ